LKIVIYRNDGLGDLIVSTPLIQSIKKNFNESRIFLICSNRNIELAKQFKLENLIDNYCVLDEKKKTFLQIIDVVMKTRAFKPDYSIILKSSNTNYTISLTNPRHEISGIVSLNINKKQKKIFTPLKFIIDHYMQHSELIDCRDDYYYSKGIHMSDHNKSLLLKIFPSINTRYINDYYAIKQKNYLADYLKDHLDSTLLHLDEKWIRSKLEINIKLLIDELSKSVPKLIITFGHYLTKYNSILIKEFDFKEVNKNMYKYKNILLIKKLSVSDLMYIASISSLIITHEGGLTHIASIYRKKLINIFSMINNGHSKNLASKWLPKTEEYIEADLDNLNNLPLSVKKILEN